MEKKIWNGKFDRDTLMEASAGVMGFKKEADIAEVGDVETEPMEIDTSKYEFTHGRVPARNQYGSWIFGRKISARVTGDVAILGTSDAIEIIGNYAMASKKAIRHAKKQNWNAVEVLP